MTHISVLHLYYLRFFAICFISIFALLGAGCSWFYSESPAPQQPSAIQEQELNDQPEDLALKPPQEHSTDLEILWLVPEQPIDRFELEYGSSEEKLDHLVEIAPAQLQLVEDAQNGKVYRYILKAVPQKGRLFLTLRSVRGEERSAPTPIFVVQER